MMLTLRGLFKDGQITLLEEARFIEGEHQVLVTFLDTDDQLVALSKKEHNLLIGERLGLTPREFEVLNLLQQGMTNKQMAESMGIAHGTVRNYLTSIYQKLEVDNRTSALAKAIELGLLASD